jgi:hypothetical protein
VWGVRFHTLVCDLRLPKLDVNKFDGLEPTIWVTQMEHYFSLHGVITLSCLGSLALSFDFSKPLDFLILICLLNV